MLHLDLLLWDNLRLETVAIDVNPQLPDNLPFYKNACDSLYMEDIPPELSKKTKEEVSRKCLPVVLYSWNW